MKTRVKATGEIVDVELSHYIGDVAWYITKCHASYPKNELEFIDAPEGYWTRLEHQYAGMAMQGMMAHTNIDYDEIVDLCVEFAHALVEKYKKEEK